MTDSPILTPKEAKELMEGKIRTKAVAQIESVEDDTKYGPHGGFTAVLSSPRRDRDGDIWPMEEWIQPLPDRITVDADHGMSVSTTIGSARPYFDDGGRLMIDASFSSIPRAQEVRTLVKEGHVGSVSVAALTDTSKKSGEQKRELLNAGVVAIPANPDAVILDAKESKRPGVTIDVTPVVDMEALKAVIAELKATVGATGGGGDRALIQAIHDASVHLGASCVTFEEEAEGQATGASEGANNKSATGTTTDGNIDIKVNLKDSTFSTASGEAVTFANHDEARAFFTDMLKSIDDADAEGMELVEAGQIKSSSPESGMTMEQFKAALAEVLTPTESPADEAESPAEAAAATDEVPAPADEAADEVEEAADDVDPQKMADHMLMGLYATHNNL